MALIRKLSDNFLTQNWLFGAHLSSKVSICRQNLSHSFLKSRILINSYKRCIGVLIFVPKCTTQSKAQYNRLRIGTVQSIARRHSHYSRLRVGTVQSIARSTVQLQSIACGPSTIDCAEALDSEYNKVGYNKLPLKTWWRVWQLHLFLRVLSPLVI